jgi:hypothetical protein
MISALAMRFPESKQDNLVYAALIAAEKPAESGSWLAACFASQFTMKDGTVVTFRLIRREDEPLMANFHQTLSAHSVYMRYFCSLTYNHESGTSAWFAFVMLVAIARQLWSWTAETKLRGNIRSWESAD